MRKNILAATGALALAAAVVGGVGTPAQAQDTIKIGWAISKTGPFAAGAGGPPQPDNKVWV
jgi:branched-chain amino acid transport system substrate-binding protein